MTLLYPNRKSCGCFWFLSSSAEGLDVSNCFPPTGEKSKRIERACPPAFNWGCSKWGFSWMDVWVCSYWQNFHWVSALAASGEYMSFKWTKRLVGGGQARRQSLTSLQTTKFLFLSFALGWLASSPHWKSQQLFWVCPKKSGARYSSCCPLWLKGCFV